MAAGEILGLVGRSGEGKSTIGMAILKLLSLRGAVATGEIRFRGRDLLALSEREMRRVRGREIGLVPQSPIAALNPALTIGAQFREAWNAHSAAPFEAFAPRLDELLASVSLPAGPQFLRRYPRELSVGIAQRVLIAMALVHGATPLKVVVKLTPVDDLPLPATMPATCVPCPYSSPLRPFNISP
jgi:ABC-type glutathione transport system ATPase component